MSKSKRLKLRNFHLDRPTPRKWAEEFCRVRRELDFPQADLEQWMKIACDLCFWDFPTEEELAQVRRQVILCEMQIPGAALEPAEQRMNDDAIDAIAAAFAAVRHYGLEPSLEEWCDEVWFHGYGNGLPGESGPNPEDFDNIKRAVEFIDETLLEEQEA